HPGPAAGGARLAGLWRVAEDVALPVEQDESGQFVYVGSPVQAVGAKPRTLTEAVTPRLLVRDDQPESVLISLSEIQADSRLNWVLQSSKRLHGDDDEFFVVPWEVWQERAAEAVDAWLPERDGDPLARRLALAERAMRMCRYETELAGRFRVQMIVAATQLGMNRRQIGEVLGLSPARVQQLYDDAQPEEVAAVKRALAGARVLLEAMPDQVTVGKLSRPEGWGADEFDEVLAACENFGLLERDAESLQVTDLGRALREG